MAHELLKQLSLLGGHAQTYVAGGASNLSRLFELSSSSLFIFLGTGGFLRELREKCED